MQPGRAHNPFSTRHTGPGNLPYRFGDGASRERLVKLIRDNNWRGQLVGPRGVGKSTLLHDLEACARQSGLATAHWRVMQESPRLPLGWRWRLRKVKVLFLDSAEVLGRRKMEDVTRFTVKRGMGLVMTGHEAVEGLPVINLSVDAGVFGELVRGLLAKEEVAVEEWVARGAEALARNGGNAREALFELYDMWERN